MTDIVLCTLNAKYIHSAFGLRYLYANLGNLQSKTRVMEFDINRDILDICESILESAPKILGLGVYIWNATQSFQLLQKLKSISPEIIVVLGGPEVSYEPESQSICHLADYVVCGEADLTFPELVSSLLGGKFPKNKIINSTPPDVASLKLPYSLYSEKDIASRILYVEASRGCPFTCEFCLSSLDIPVRQFDVEQFLGEIDQLLKRGAKNFKFVDRTFNLNLRFSTQILLFFLERYFPNLFLHFEMVPDRLPDKLKEIIKRFPVGSLQFEVGIQSFNPEVGKLISRRQDFAKIAENLTFLRRETGVHVHADLIVGLPGESIESFASGFNKLVELGPQEIQVGILKRLRGTPIVRHDETWQMKYSPHPPYEILCNKLIDFPTMQRMRRFAKYWDLLFNSGKYKSTIRLLWSNCDPFCGFIAFSDWLFAESGLRYGFSQKNMINYIYDYLVLHLKLDSSLVVKSLQSDFPTFEKDVSLSSKILPAKRVSQLANQRQQNHF